MPVFDYINKMGELCSRYDIDTTSVLHWNYRGFDEFPPEYLKNCNTNITDIYLKENMITIFPRGLSCFKSLKNLYLCGNEIKVLPREIGLVVTLQCLDLRENLLTVLPEEISLVRNLKCLILDDNNLRELPLSLRKLKRLRYLSVCDNNLLWLPQRPVSNYYAAEFKFWRNKTLQHIPFSLWLHMLKNQQIKCHYIGCFSYPHIYTSHQGRKIKIVDNRFFPDTEIIVPSQYIEVQNQKLSPPSLMELCIRKCFVQMSRLAEELDTNNNVNMEWKDNEDFTTQNGKDGCRLKVGNLDQVLPVSLAEEITNGPTGFCEVLNCKMPMFRCTILDITTRVISTVESSDDILVTACFCSGDCREKWRTAHQVTPLKWIAMC